jgi:dUTP pyrophosphatase
MFLDEKAMMPKRSHESDTGYDLTFIGIDTIKGDTIYFRTGIAVQPPPGFYFEIVPRSSISKLPLQMANSVAVIDEHYRGEILVPIRVMHSGMGQDVGRARFPNGLVKMFDTKPQSLYDVAEQILRRKPRLVQMILRERLDTQFERALELTETERGDGGFGSTDDDPFTGGEPEGTITKASVRKSMVKRAED